ncbi:DNA methyltransferase [Bremerella sp. JC817]|uniref:Eco57I restriction-modification methylase domain-containing protein n=1 Tax=Bremerella sp. JC817 TaxID=3231756 RepID=UPI003457BE5C
MKKPQRDALVKFWEAWQDELATIRILDPACGSGAFLIEAFDQLHSAYQASNDQLEELRGHRTLFDLDRRILQNNIFGVDLNEEAIEICRLSLWIKTAERGKTLTSLDETIRAGNSVVSDSQVHTKAFNWEESFPDVFANGGFDVVVGNPPYIRQEWLAPYKSHWEKRFKSYYGTADIFTYFYELGVDLLSVGGRLGFITSGSWVRGKFGTPLRSFISESAKVESIVDFGEFQPFDGAEMIRPSITVLSKQNAGGSMRLFKWLTKGMPPTNLSDVLTESPTLSTSHLSEKAWELESDDVLSLRKKLFSQGVSLKKYAGKTLLYGVKTGLNEVFLLRNEQKNAIVKNDPKCLDLFKPFLRGQDIREWHVSWDGYWLLCLKSSGDFDWPWKDAGSNAEAIFEEEYPSVYAYVKKYEDRLRKRSDQGKYWWELRTCNYWDSFDAPKVFWPDICKQPRFNLDTQRYYIGDTAFMVAQNDPFLLGVLASWSTWFCLSKTAQPLRLRGDRWQYRLKKQWLEALPIPNASPAARDSIGSLAESCNHLGQELFDLQDSVRQRLISTFGETPEGTQIARLNIKSTSWWTLTLNQLGEGLKASFDLDRNPFQNPNLAEDWELYVSQKKQKGRQLKQMLQAAEAELNDHVYRVFNLNESEIKLLQQEVEH